MKRVAGIVLGMVVVAGCSLLPPLGDDVAADVPRACEAVYSAARCEAMADVVAADVGKGRGDVTAVTILPNGPPGSGIGGGGSRIRVRIEFQDGSSHESRLCGGVAMDAACSDEPHLRLATSIEGGYRDVPCGADPDDVSACATPLPSIDPTAATSARPIQVASLSIPIERTGPHEVVLGEGLLPNGIWTSARLDFADDWPSDLALRDATIVLELRSLEADGLPFDNYYRHGWRPGVERVQAVVLFDVLWFEPGATLDIRDVDVR